MSVYHHIDDGMLVRDRRMQLFFSKRVQRSQLTITDQVQALQEFGSAVPLLFLCMLTCRNIWFAAALPGSSLSGAVAEFSN
jgi:hypothetical protein